MNTQTKFFNTLKVFIALSIIGFLVFSFNHISPQKQTLIDLENKLNANNNYQALQSLKCLSSYLPNTLQCTIKKNKAKEKTVVINLMADNNILYHTLPHLERIGGKIKILSKVRSIDGYKLFNSDYENVINTAISAT